MTQRLGVFGGTFDPPHLGHLILASEAFAQLGLNKVLWVLTGVPPHKIGAPVSALADRLAMLQLALEKEPAFSLSTVDMDRAGPHYTVETLGVLAGQNPRAELVLLIGGDSFHDLPSWHTPATLVAACAQIGVMRRPGDVIDLSALERDLPGLTSKVRFVDAPLLEIASHEIRARARTHMPFRYFVLPAIYQYIVAHGLYQAP